MNWAGLPTLSLAQGAKNGSLGDHLCSHTTQVAALKPEIKIRPQDIRDLEPGAYVPYASFWGVVGDVELFGTWLAFSPLARARGLRMGPFGVIPALIPAW